MVRILSRAFAVDTAWPQNPAHARQLTAQAVADGVEVVAAMGGDGVAHHVAQGLARTPTALGLIPTGTTNVYSRLLGIPEKPIAAARLLAGHSQIQTFPLLTIEDGPRRDHALFAAGFGFDADVVRTAESEPQRKYRFGGLHYARSAISTLISDYRRRSTQAGVRIQGETVEALAILIQFHPIYTYFGRLKLKLAETAAGSMTVLTVDSLPARRLLRIASTLLRGADLGQVPGFRIWRGVEEFQIEGTPSISGQADGELTGTWTEARASFLPDAISVVAPSP